MSRTPAKRPTVRSIAAEAGVSAATVSRVLTGASAVAPETATRVTEVVARLRAERFGEGPPTVYLRCPYILTDYFGFLVSLIAERLRASGLRVELDAGNAAQKTRPLSALAERRDIAGAIVILPPESVDDLVDASRRMPLVVIDPREILPDSVASVGANHYAAARALAEHLTALGHRRIGAIVGPLAWKTSVDRLDGLAAALAAVDALPLRQLHRTVDPTFEAGTVAAAELLDLGEPPTAIMCFNDKVAVGALLAASQRGIRVPEDLSVVGFDDLDVGHVTSPPLTSVRQPLAQMSDVAVDLLLRMIGGDPRARTHVEVRTQLIERESCGEVVRPPAGRDAGLL